MNDSALADGRPIMLQDEIDEQVEAAKEAVPGLLESVGKGEVPVGPPTCSLWVSLL